MNIIERYLDWWETLPKQFVKWGLMGYLFGGLIKFLLLFPNIIITVFGMCFQDIYKGYLKTKQEYQSDSSKES